MIAGLDVGRRRDATALVRLGPAIDLHVLPPLRLSEQADRLMPLLLPCDLVAVDCTGLGLGLSEMLQERGLPVLHVQITAGSTVKITGNGSATAGKSWMMGRVAAAIHQGLRIDHAATNAQLLRSQMAAMLPSRTKRGYRIEASKGHDDLVLALALALLGRDAHERRSGIIRH